MKTLFFDCFAGASGNMILAGLVALGVDREELIEGIKLLNIPDFKIEFSPVNRAGIAALYAHVQVPHEHAHRHLHDIEKILRDSLLADEIKQRATAIFTRLAEAEAKVHGVALQQVHFHEVGALDAIIDVVGACIGFQTLCIERFVGSKIHVGSGFVSMAHGKFPVPPPAVAEILQDVPVYSTEIEGELITPTGAAIIASVCAEFGPLPEMRIEKTAYGAGSREYRDFPNVLRLMLGESKHSELQSLTERMLLIETNIDDLSPQILSFVMERALEMGALDCWFTPIQMKKNRPATKVSLLCSQAKREVLTELLYRETTTLGVRIKEIERNCLPREIIKIETRFGAINVKVVRSKGEIIHAKPEYDQLREVALKWRIPLQSIEREILAAMQELGVTPELSQRGI